MFEVYGIALIPDIALCVGTCVGTTMVVWAGWNGTIVEAEGIAMEVMEGAVGIVIEAVSFEAFISATTFRVVRVSFFSLVLLILFLKY